MELKKTSPTMVECNVELAGINFKLRYWQESVNQPRLFIINKDFSLGDEIDNEELKSEAIDILKAELSSIYNMLNE